jgi:hypothetical protein
LPTAFCRESEEICRSCSSAIILRLWSRIDSLAFHNHKLVRLECTRGSAKSRERVGNVGRLRSIFLQKHRRMTTWTSARSPQVSDRPTNSLTAFQRLIADCGLPAPPAQTVCLANPQGPLHSFSKPLGLVVSSAHHHRGGAGRRVR